VSRAYRAHVSIIARPALAVNTCRGAGRDVRWPHNAERRSARHGHHRRHPGYVHYAAAKAAVEALTIGLAKELAADEIRVNAVAPGVIRTAIHEAAGDPGRPDRVAARIPLGRPGEPGEVAPAIAWLLGPEAAYVTGAVLRVAGGL
jgi:NAD(P)-dependent dehydrogenase (short-subunit alcohol dehydrogenase family)